MHDHILSVKQRQADNLETAVIGDVFVESMDVVRGALPSLLFGQYQITTLEQERWGSCKHVASALADARSVQD